MFQLKALGVWPKAPEPAPVDPKKKVSPEEQARTDKDFAEAKLLHDAAAEATPTRTACSQSTDVPALPACANSKARPATKESPAPTVLTAFTE